MLALKPGDRLRIQRCGPTFVTVTFRDWDGGWICSRTLYDISPVNVLKVNGKPVDFTNGEPRPND